MAWGAIIGAVGSIAGSAIQAGAAKDAAGSLSSALDVRKQASRLGVSLEDIFGTRLEPPDFEFTEEDIFRITERLANFNATTGTDLANQSASRINTNTLDDLESGMRRLFGGDGSFDRQRDQVNQNTEDFLAGRLSQSTRRGLARRSIQGGASAIGPDAVDDTYAAYLGLTTEDVVSRGTEVYRSLYATYRQSFPLTTGADILQFTALRPAEGVNFALNTAVAQYEAALNQALAESAPDPVASGLFQAELQRAGAVSGANLQAGSAQGALVANAGQQIGGIVSGLQSGGGSSGQRFDFGNLGGVNSRI